MQKSRNIVFPPSDYKQQPLTIATLGVDIINYLFLLTNGLIGKITLQNTAIKLGYRI